MVSSVGSKDLGSKGSCGGDVVASSSTDAGMVDTARNLCSRRPSIRLSPSGIQSLLRRGKDERCAMVGMVGRTIRHACVLLELLPTPTRADDGREVIAATPTARRLDLLVICIARCCTDLRTLLAVPRSTVTLHVLLVLTIFIL